MPPSTKPGQRIAQAEGRHVVERHEIDPVELACVADRLVGDREVVGRRQPLLLGAVARIRLDVLVEQLADDRGDELVGRDRAEAADRMTAQPVRAGRAQVDRVGRRAPGDGGCRAPRSRAARSPCRASQSKTAARSPAPTSRDPRPAEDRQDPRDHHALGRGRRTARPSSRGSAGCRRPPARPFARRPPTVAGVAQDAAASSSAGNGRKRRDRRRSPPADPARRSSSTTAIAVSSIVPIETMISSASCSPVVADRQPDAGPSAPPTRPSPRRARRGSRS